MSARRRGPRVPLVTYLSLFDARATHGEYLLADGDVLRVRYYWPSS